MKFRLSQVGLFFCFIFAPAFIFSQPAFTQEPTHDSAAALYTCPPEPHDEIILETDAQGTSRLYGQLVASTRHLRNALKAQDPQQTTRIPGLAKLRKRHLIQLLRKDAAAVSSELLSRTEQDTIGSTTENCVETSFEVDGTAQVFIADNFDEGLSKTYYFLLTDQGERWNLYPLSVLEFSVQTGDRVHVRGLQIDDNIVFDGHSGLSISTSDAGATVESNQQLSVVDRKTLVILVYFQDTPQPSETLDQIEDIMDDVRGYYVENSYNHLIISGVINPDRGADVVGWYPLSLYQSCDYNLIREEALNAAMTDPSTSIDQNNYAGFVIVAPYGACSSGGYAGVGGDTSWISNPRFGHFFTTAHEIGHNLGNHHASFLLCFPFEGFPVNGQGCDFSEYGDPYDIMGTSVGHFNAPHKELVGFLHAAQILEIIASGTYSIEPIETATGGVKALKLPRGVNDYLYIEFRKRIGFDGSFGGTDVYSGASLHILKTSNKTLLIDPDALNASAAALRKGETFVDPASGSSITVDKVGRDSLIVTIQSSGLEFNPPTVGITSPIPEEELSGTVTITATATDDSGMSRVEFYYDGQGLVENFASITSESSDDIYAVSLDTYDIPNGLFNIYARAIDVLGNSTDSLSVPIEVLNTGDTNPPRVSLISPLKGTVQTGTEGILQARATDSETRIWKVEFYTDNNPLWPFSIRTTETDDIFVSDIDTTGPHSAMARAFDLQGNTKDTLWSTFKVVDGIDINPPAVQFINPDPTVVDGIYSGVIDVGVVAFDNVGVSYVEFYLRTLVLLTTVVDPPFTFAWDTTTVSKGLRFIVAVAYDEAGNTGSSIANIQVDQPPVLFPIGDADGYVDAIRGVGETIALGASDPDGDPLTFTITPLDPLPAGIIADEVNARIDILDSAPAGAWTITVSVADDSGLTDEETFTLRIEELCGNSMIEPHEECDDGDTLPGDGCSAICFFEVCGNDYLDPGEECDDSNTVSGDGCSEICLDEGDITPPTVTITSPTDGSDVSRLTTIEVSASDDVGVTLVEIIIDDVLTASFTAEPYSYIWNTREVASGPHTIKATGYDAANNSSSSSITVNKPAKGKK